MAKRLDETPALRSQPTALPGVRRHHVVISNPKHPHYGRRGYIEVIDGNVTVIRVLGGTPMVRVEFTDQGVTDAAFATGEDIWPDQLAPENAP